jgi:hypothetical protein
VAEPASVENSAHDRAMSLLFLFFHLLLSPILAHDYFLQSFFVILLSGVITFLFDFFPSSFFTPRRCIWQDSKTAQLFQDRASYGGF